jgi:hypothetical protein
MSRTYRDNYPCSAPGVHVSGFNADLLGFHT